MSILTPDLLSPRQSRKRGNKFAPSASNEPKRRMRHQGPVTRSLIRQESLLPLSSEPKVHIQLTPEYPEYNPTQATNCWVDINLSAPVYEENESARAPVDIVAVIDRSGSMSGGKLDLVKKTLHFVVSQLTPKDRLCLLVYDDTVDMIFNLTSIT